MTRAAAAVTGLALPALLALSFPGCGNLDVQDPGPLMIELSVTPASAAVGTEVTYRFEASGDQLRGVIVYFGDGAIDSVATLLARTAQGNVTHVYNMPGAYTARAVVIDGVFDEAEDTATVVITPAPAPAPTQRQLRNRRSGVT